MHPNYKEEDLRGHHVFSQKKKLWQFKINRMQMVPSAYAMKEDR